MGEFCVFFVILIEISFRMLNYVDLIDIILF